MTVLIDLVMDERAVTWVALLWWLRVKWFGMVKKATCRRRALFVTGVVCA